MVAGSRSTDNLDGLDRVIAAPVDLASSDGPGAADADRRAGDSLRAVTAVVDRGFGDERVSRPVRAGTRFPDAAPLSTRGGGAAPFVPGRRSPTESGSKRSIRWPSWWRRCDRTGHLGECCYIAVAEAGDRPVCRAFTGRFTGRVFTGQARRQGVFDRARSAGCTAGGFACGPVRGDLCVFSPWMVVWFLAEAVGEANGDVEAAGGDGGGVHGSAVDGGDR